MNYNGPVSAPSSSSRSYARCLTRPPPWESTNNNAETSQQHRDENLLKKTSLKLRSRAVKKSEDTNSTPAFIPQHQPKSEWTIDVDYFEEEPDSRQIDRCHGDKEDFSRDARLEEGDTLEVFRPAWLRRGEAHINCEADDADSADDKIPDIKRKKKSKACKAWRMKVHSLKDTDEEGDKVHFAPTWMKKIVSKSANDVIVTKTTTHYEDGQEHILNDEAVGTELKISADSDRSTEELTDNIESDDERVQCQVIGETSSNIFCPKEDSTGSVKGNAESLPARSVQQNALNSQKEGDASQQERSSIQIDQMINCVGDTRCSWSVYHPEFERQLGEFIFQVLLRAVVSVLVEEVVRNSLEENAERRERTEWKATGGHDGGTHYEENNGQRIQTPQNDVLVPRIISNANCTLVYKKLNNNPSLTGGVDGGKSAACCGKFIPGLGSNRQGRAQLINTNGTMRSTTSEPGELVAGHSPPSHEGSAPHQDVLSDAGSRQGSLEATKDYGDSSFESIFGEETLIHDCLQEDAKENGYAASVAIQDGGEEDGFIADVRLLWMLDEDGVDGDEMVKGYWVGCNGGSSDVEELEEDWDDDDEGDDDAKEEAGVGEDAAAGVDTDDEEEELMTDVQPPWETIDFFNLSDDNSTDEDLQLEDASHQTSLEAPDCKIHDTTDNGIVRIHYKNLTHIRLSPGRAGRRPQIILELDVLVTPGNFEKRRLEFYRFCDEKPDKRTCRYRKPFKSRSKKHCRSKGCETPSSVHSHDDGKNGHEVLGNGRVGKGKGIKGLRKKNAKKV